MHEVDLALAGTGEATSGSFFTPESRETQALQALRDIISMQRLRLRMMLTGKRMLDSRPETAQQQTFLDWLQSQQQWRDRLSEQLAVAESDAAGERTQPLSI